MCKGKSSYYFNIIIVAVVAGVGKQSSRWLQYSIHMRGKNEGKSIAVLVVLYCTAAACTSRCRKTIESRFSAIRHTVPYITKLPYRLVNIHA
jgi:hypothetical protein